MGNDILSLKKLSVVHIFHVLMKNNYGHKYVNSTFMASKSTCIILSFHIKALTPLNQNGLQTHSVLPVVKVAWSERKEFCCKFEFIWNLRLNYLKYYILILIASEKNIPFISPESLSKKYCFNKIHFSKLWVHMCVCLFSNCYLFVCESWGKTSFFCPVKYIFQSLQPMVPHLWLTHV